MNEPNHGAEEISELPIWRFIDRTATLKRLAGDEQLFGQLVDFFCEDYPPLLRALQEAVARGDVAAIDRAGHSLKGLAANLGAGEIAAQADQIENCDRRRELSNLSTVCEKLAHDLANLAAALKQYRQRSGGFQPP